MHFDIVFAASDNDQCLSFISEVSVVDPEREVGYSDDDISVNADESLGKVKSNHWVSVFCLSILCHVNFV